MIDYRGGMREFLRWLGIYLNRGKYMKRPLRSVIRGEPSQVTSCDKKYFYQHTKKIYFHQ
jgi:hypothetical protein